MNTRHILLLAGLLAGPAHAIEYVTLTKNTTTRNVNATDLVEVVGTNKNNYGTADSLVLNFADGASTALVLRGKEVGSPYSDMAGNSFTGLTSVSLSIEGSVGPVNLPCVTLKITPADEIGATPPGAESVLPENTTGDFNVVVESSDDLVNWMVFSSQVISAATSKKFYRTRMIKVVAP